MNIAELLDDKSLKPKEKTELLSRWILENSKHIKVNLDYAAQAKNPAKATCIEAFEFATKENSKLATLELLQFVTLSLSAKAPRVKWESAKVIGNIAKHFPKQLNEAIKSLLVNTEHDGTVVRWSAAYALGEILVLKTPLNSQLIPSIEAIIQREEKNSIRKIHAAALKKLSM